eukprot:gb/GEZN01001057.1/.p1 GENE.gb/GEZN01001057.1/~~gb/GEZN01001057.1/.p1  ORF type:complete len:823 (-),score=151.48 gb/GEZN01001057.1/:870-3338(-)
METADDGARCRESFLWGWGLSDIHRLESTKPRLLQSFGRQICRVLAGQRHVIALDSSGDLYCWGIGMVLKKPLTASCSSSVSCSSSSLAQQDPLFQPLALDPIDVLPDNVIGVRDSDKRLLRRTVSHPCLGKGKLFAVLGQGQDSDDGLSGRILEWAWHSVETPTPTGPGPGDLKEESSKSLCMPRLLPALPTQLRFKSLECGMGFTVAICTDGHVFSWGQGVRGQLGHGEAITSCPQPRLVEAFNTSRVNKLACGFAHTVAIVESGTVWVWGCAGSGRLGRPCLQQGIMSARHAFIPEVLPPFSPQPIVDVSCGYHSSFVVDTLGHLFAWGGNDKGQLGLGSRLNQARPCRVFLRPENSGTAGRGDTKGSVDSLLWAGVAQEHKHGSSSAWSLAQRVAPFSGKQEEGKVQQRQLLPLVGEQVVCISAGAFHAAAVTRQGDLWVWGWGRHGQLGLGDQLVTQLWPRRVSALQGTEVRSVACGATYTCAVADTFIKVHADYFGSSDGEAEGLGVSINTTEAAGLGVSSSMLSERRLVDLGSSARPHKKESLANHTDNNPASACGTRDDTLSKVNGRHSGKTWPSVKPLSPLKEGPLLGLLDAATAAAAIKKERKDQAVAGVEQVGQEGLAKSNSGNGPVATLFHEETGKDSDVDPDGPQPLHYAYSPSLSLSLVAQSQEATPSTEIKQMGRTPSISSEIRPTSREPGRFKTPTPPTYSAAPVLSFPALDLSADPSSSDPASARMLSCSAQLVALPPVDLSAAGTFGDLPHQSSDMPSSSSPCSSLSSSSSSSSSPPPAPTPPSPSSSSSSSSCFRGCRGICRR